jgi:formyltetrahydrofolate synthetase
MAKTQYSLSTDAAAKGVPTGFRVLVRDVRAAVGAGYIYRKLYTCPVCGRVWYLTSVLAPPAAICGDIMTIPGLPTRPGFYDVDIDTKTGRVIGLF